MMISFVSCGSLDVIISQKHPAKPSNCKLDVYFEESEVTQEFETIALIDSKTGTSAFHKKTLAAAVDNAKAGEIGADAIIVVDTEKKRL